MRHEKMTGRPITGFVWTLVSLMVCGLLSASLTGTADAYLDDFNDPVLSNIWTYRDPKGNGQYSIAAGKLVLNLKAEADMWIRGTDGGVIFLAKPPDIDSFIVEMKANAAVNDGPQPKATHLGIVFFNQAEWAYSIWGPYGGDDRGARSMGRDIRLEDCIGLDYRWRVDANPTHIGIDSVNTNQDIYIKVVKSGDEMEFFARGDATEDWVSGGVDTKLAPHYTQGSHQIGILAKSWFLSVATTFEIDYFDIREINAKSLDIAGDLSTTWGQVKGK